MTTRNDLSSLQSDFIRLDNLHVGIINEVQTMMLMESRGLFKSAFELRLITSQFGEDKSDVRSLTFLEVCCAVYGTSWEALNEFVDEEARDRALLTSKVAAKEIAVAAAKITEAKLQEENAANERAAIIEKESRLVRNLTPQQLLTSNRLIITGTINLQSGVAGMSAFFLRQHIEGCRETTLSNEQRVSQTSTSSIGITVYLMLRIMTSLDKAGGGPTKRTPDCETEIKGRCGGSCET